MTSRNVEKLEYHGLGKAFVFETSNSYTSNSHISPKRPAVEAPQQLGERTCPGDSGAGSCRKDALTRRGKPSPVAALLAGATPYSRPSRGGVRRRTGVGRGQERGAKCAPRSPPRLDGWTRVNNHCTRAGSRVPTQASSPRATSDPSASGRTALPALLQRSVPSLRLRRRSRPLHPCPHR
ncbi:hypothetical protein J1605_015015 [Eschrichtius robustus]|uniref:Uncharacterized protein n=1 Tax=Eschrichtius robustus TaxID=9764 RepID=A0AB34GAG0_ESCRO|nr:hypothetical protein J1605_015015 [Eschrichtius robustus]